MAQLNSFVRKYGPLLTPIIIFVLAYAIGGWMYPKMQRPQVFLNLFINNGSLLLVSIGMTLVILTGGIDLSVGGVLWRHDNGIRRIVAARASPWVVIPLMLLMGTALGSVMGGIIHYLKVQPFIVTLMGLFFARGMAYIISLVSITITDSTYKYLALTAIPVQLGNDEYIYIATLIAPVMLLIAIYLSNFTRFGRTVYAIGNNEQSALLMGLAVGRTKILAYCFSGFCSALAGIVFTFCYCGIWPIRYRHGVGCHCLYRHGRHAPNRRRRQYHRHTIWCVDQRHYRFYFAVQRHLKFMVDAHRRRFAHPHFHWDSGVVLSQEKDSLIT